MSNTFNFNFSLFDNLTAVWVVCAVVGGGGALATTIRRNWRQARVADPEAIELQATTAIQGNVALNAGDDADSGAVGMFEGGVVTEVSVAVDAGNNAGPETVGTAEGGVADASN